MSKQYEIGDKVSFYDVANRKKVNTYIDKFILRSNKKGQRIRIAVGENKYGDKIYRIIGPV
jgi:menaquinone-dependent protoporphyrinogen IX oxidase